jgi:DNA-binding transcriptional ArsR family regulator
MMDQPDFNTVVSVFKALAHESRLKIIGLLAQDEYSVSELAEALDLKDPTVSHHLNKLHELDLVSMRQDGTTHYYKLNAKMLEKLNKEVFSPEKVSTYARDTDVDAWESKVMRSFVDGQRLKDIPNNYKKRLVILKWLASDFEFDRRYTEKEVNEIIQHHHGDYATLRREFVDNKFMERDHGIYWRLPQDVTDAKIAELLSGSGPQAD